MRKYISLLSILFISTLLFGETSLSISDEAIEISRYGESEYNIEFSTSSFSAGFDIFSSTDDVTIYVNQSKFSTDSLYLNDLSSGNYLIKIKKSGYETFSKWITLSDDQRVVLDVTLARKYGYLNIKSELEDIEIYLDDISIENNQAIPTGSYSIKVRKFGYIDVSFTSYIYGGITTVKEVQLLPLEFDFVKIKSDRNIFNPLASEGFKSLNLNIEVNGPEKGTITVKNSSNEMLFNDVVEFTTWNTLYNFSENLGDGEYIFSISSGEKIIEYEFKSDSSLFIKNIANHRGFPGLAVIATPERNEITLSTMSFSIDYSLEPTKISLPISWDFNIIDHLSFRTGIDIGILPEEGESEIDIFAGVGTFWKYGIFQYGININYNLVDTANNQIIVNSPFGLKLDNYYLSLSPEFLYDFTQSNYIISPGTGFHFDNQKLRTGLSYRLDIENDNISHNYGAEFYYLLSNSQAYTGIIFTGDDELNFDVELNISMIL